VVAQERLQRSTDHTEAPLELAAIWSEGFKKFLNAQEELIEKLTNSNEWWIGRYRSEAGLATDLAAKLGASHSISDALKAWQEWAAQRFEMMAKDSKYLLHDRQRFAAIAHILSAGRLPDAKPPTEV
jgi:hypothetical protein